MSDELPKVPATQVEDKTVITRTVGDAPPDTSSAIFGVSIRAWIVLGAVWGVVLSHLLVSVAVLFHAVRSGDFSLVGTLTTISEPYYSVVAVGIGFYLGSKTQKT